MHNAITFFTTSCRITILSFLLGTGFLATAQIKQRKKAKPIVLFVCEHGAARSTIAAAYFNKLAKEQGQNYEAVFRGTHPDSLLTPATVKGLTSDSFNVSGWKPRIVSENDIKTAYKIITFDCSLPVRDSLSLITEQWNGIPPISKDYNLARNSIVEKVGLLLSNLPKNKKAIRKKKKSPKRH
jgi:arsenate reductase (thioredoxin)